jgi:hypothetical protein
MLLISVKKKQNQSDQWKEIDLHYSFVNSQRDIVHHNNQLDLIEDREL